MPLAVVGVLGQRDLRALDRGDDVGERDLLGRPGEHVTAADAALRADETRALDRQEDLLEVGLGRCVRSAISFTDVGRSQPCSASDSSARAA